MLLWASDGDAVDDERVGWYDEATSWLICTEPASASRARSNLAESSACRVSRGVSCLDGVTGLGVHLHPGDR